MRELRVSRVLCSAAAHELAHDGRPDSGDSWAQALEDVGVGYEVVGRLEDIRDRGETGALGVGATAEDVWLRNHVEVYVHVGEGSDVGTKRPHAGHITVPVVRQWGAGARNVFRWVINAAAHGVAIVEHRDVVGHAMACASSYSWPGKVQSAERTAREAAAAIRAKFPQLHATFGTGFPFYCTLDDTDPGAPHTPVPDSIRRFTEAQADEFVHRLVRMGTDSSTVLTRGQLERSGIALQPTRYTAYEYTRWGARPPQAPAQGTLDEFVEANVLDHGERLWPCHVCTTLADQAKFPEQSWERDFMVTCVSCVQTPFLPRAVGVLGSDIDIVALVDDASRTDPAELARGITHWIDAHPQYFRHDTRWDAQLYGAHGPLDVFVTSTEAFFSAVEAMAAHPTTWITRTVRATVTWLPVTTIPYEIGKYFALCMEPLDVDARIRTRLAEARRRFASEVSAAEVIAAYERDSFYLRQLMENAELREVIAQRLTRWSGADPAGAHSSSEGAS